MSTGPSPLYHVTLLSNFARAFDKYRRLYCKSAIPESTYPGEFYLLQRHELHIGVGKASALLARSGLAGDVLLVLESNPTREALRQHPRQGAGLVWPSSDLPITGLYRIAADGELGASLSIEGAMAASLALHASGFRPYAEVAPRSLSFLPVAFGCNAACPFCFSDASASADQRQAPIDWARTRHWIEAAAARGAQRAVITGGGEPTLLRWNELLRLVRACADAFSKVVLITNGARLAALEPDDLEGQVQRLDQAGLSVLAVSRHHPEEAVNRCLMKLETHTGKLLAACARQRRSIRLRPRLICVLQRGGVETAADIGRYVQWAAAEGAGDVCFKELYVSTSQESLYHSRQVNEWSAAHQVPLSRVHDWAHCAGLTVSARLPWGAPIYSGVVAGRPMRVAAYTEPSLFWERRHGVARSWNVMADGTCLASLEDRSSAVALPSMAGVA